jgi:shikimate kinase
VNAPDLRNIVLVGFMGTGKTAVGQVLAKRLARPLVDMDATLEQRAGKTIADLFAQDGEPHFRMLERALVRELAVRDGLVIAAGGGVVLNPDNLRDFARTGLVVCLTAPPEEILRRVGQQTHRPLLEGSDKGQSVRELLARRQPLYEAVPQRIDTTRLTPEAVADEILRRFAGGAA